MVDGVSVTCAGAWKGAGSAGGDVRAGARGGCCCRRRRHCPWRARPCRGPWGPPRELGSHRASIRTCRGVKHGTYAFVAPTLGRSGCRQRLHYSRGPPAQIREAPLHANTRERAPIFTLQTRLQAPCGRCRGAADGSHTPRFRQARCQAPWHKQFANHGMRVPIRFRNQLRPKIHSAHTTQQPRDFSSASTLCHHTLIGFARALVALDQLAGEDCLTRISVPTVSCMIFATPCARPRCPSAAPPKQLAV